MSFLLSHYTNRAGLEGIASNQNIRAGRYLSLNDKTEYEFAWRHLLDAAQTNFLNLIPNDLIEKARNIGLPQNLDKHLLNPNSESPYGHLYVTSFALAKNENDERDGNLTLWDRYTKNEGYCLQFERGEIERAVNNEDTWSSYSYINFSKISYGIDKNVPKFLEIEMQIRSKLLESLRFATRDPRIDALIRKYFDPRYVWNPQKLANQIMAYCGAHKHSAFEDEREFRILAYPSSQISAVMLTGLKMPKNIYGTLDGKKYIILGEHFRPGIQPLRIIVGPKADRNIDHILDRFPERPVLRYSEIPVR